MPESKKVKLKKNETRSHFSPSSFAQGRSLCNSPCVMAFAIVSYISVREDDPPINTCSG